MTVTAPPRGRPGELDEIERIEALIEEARRRARRRRRRNAALALLLSAVTFGVGVRYGGLGGDGGDAADADPWRLPLGAGRLDRTALAAGDLTLIGAPPDRRLPAGTVLGWYGFSTLDAGGRLRPLLRCPDGYDYCGIVEALDWSPDGRRLAFTIGAHGALNPFIGLHVLDVVTGVEQHVLDGRACARVVRADLAWAPDGSRLAYVCESATRGGRALVVYEPGTGVRQLPTRRSERVSSPTWSPTGDEIAFASKVAGAPSAIVSMRLDGLRRALVARDASAPDWSPDGSTIAYRSGCGGIKLVTPAGREVTPAAGPFPCRSIGVAGTPVWSPDGRWLAISTHSGVYVVRSDGSRLSRLTEHTGIGPHGGRPSWRSRPAAARAP